MLFPQVIRVLGLLGALDPHKHRMNLGVISESEGAVSKSEFKLGSQDAGSGGKSDLFCIHGRICPPFVGFVEGSFIVS